MNNHNNFKPIQMRLTFCLIFILISLSPLLSQNSTTQTSSDYVVVNMSTWYPANTCFFIKVDSTDRRFSKTQYFDRSFNLKTTFDEFEIGLDTIAQNEIHAFDKDSVLIDFKNNQYFYRCNYDTYEGQVYHVFQKKYKRRFQKMVKVEQTIVKNDTLFYVVRRYVQRKLSQVIADFTNNRPHRYQPAHYMWWPTNAKGPSIRICKPDIKKGLRKLGYEVSAGSSFNDGDIKTLNKFLSDYGFPQYGLRVLPEGALILLDIFEIDEYGERVCKPSSSSNPFYKN